MRDDILLTLTPVAQVYPASARLMGLLSIMEVRAHTVSRLRRDLRALYETSPSPQAWLMAARVEAQLAGGAHRMQVSHFSEDLQLLKELTISSQMHMVSSPGARTMCRSILCLRHTAFRSEHLQHALLKCRMSSVGL